MRFDEISDFEISIFVQLKGTFNLVFVEAWFI